jgi:hypothetical protein
LNPRPCTCTCAMFPALLSALTAGVPCHWKFGAGGWGSFIVNFMPFSMPVP